MKFLTWLFSLTLVLGGCAPLVYRVEAQKAPVAGPSPQARWLAQIAEQRPSSPVKGVANGEAVVADYMPEDAGRCGAVLLTYQNLSYTETWKVCPGGTVSRVASDGAALPTGSEFNAIRHAVSQGAWKLGQAQALYADYEIFAAAVGSPDANHCLTIENTVVQNERSLDVRHDRVCGE